MRGFALFAGGLGMTYAPLYLHDRLWTIVFWLSSVPWTKSIRNWHCQCILKHNSPPVRSWMNLSLRPCSPMMRATLTPALAS